MDVNEHSESPVRFSCVRIETCTSNRLTTPCRSRLDVPAVDNLKTPATRRRPLGEETKSLAGEPRPSLSSALILSK